MTRDELVEVIVAELERQSDEYRSDTPYLYWDQRDRYGIDGNVDLTAVADAILVAIEKVSRDGN